MRLFSLKLGVVLVLAYPTFIRVDAWLAFVPPRHRGSVARTPSRHLLLASAPFVPSPRHLGATLFGALLDSNTADHSVTTLTSNSKIPIHFLAGFLGAGKTSVLQHILENSEGLRLGVIVNDVAAVNIDAKLVQQKQQPDSTVHAHIIELQNGCVCCSLADELFTSLEQLTKRDGTTTAPPLDAIVVELSGVADPVALTNQWHHTVQHSLAPLVTDALCIGNVITVVDASTFGTDYMTSDMAGDRPVWFGATEHDTAAPVGCTVGRQVVELLTEQVEAAHVIIVNKQDLAARSDATNDTTMTGDGGGTRVHQVDVVRSMVQSLNDMNATILLTSYGKVPSVAQLLTTTKVLESSDEAATDHGHTTTNEIPRTELDCFDTSHSHAHTHGEATTMEAACQDATCTDPTHAHSHSHTHGEAATVEAACQDATCTDPTHAHSHSHNHGEAATMEAACQDATCTDPTHAHSHSHNHVIESPVTSTATSLDNLGIGNFVYRATRPFNAQRLMQVLYQWPVPIKDELDLTLLQEAAQEGYSIRGTNETNVSPFVNVLRSKGFCWLAPVSWSIDNTVTDENDSWRHDIAMYWSHAGRHLGMTEAGRWWSSVGSRDTMRDFFAHNPAEYERVLREDFVTVEFGDRRQELVFIGVSLQEDAIRQALDECLLTDDEMVAYRRNAESVLEMPTMLMAQ